jgi:hypothetical protein
MNFKLIVMNFLNEIRRRNNLLYVYGWIMFIGMVVCIVMTQVATTQVLGINAWIKPMKFYLSIWIFCWTMAWLLEELDNKKAVRRYSIMVAIVMTIEMLVINGQAAIGQKSHFNNSTPLNAALFSIMGIAITTLGVWTGVIAWRFFKQKQFNAPMAYIWGIRLGIILFVFFSFEGGLMASRLSHTVGSVDGSTGLPVLNWSRQYGDLRIAHFIGIHALQVLPLLGYYVFRNKQQVWIAATVYFVGVMAVFIQAMRGIPLI